MKNFKRIENKFSSLIKDVDKTIRPLVDQIDVEVISKHNAIYKRYAPHKFKFFIDAERNRFFKALDIITKDKNGGTVCDLGGFVPYLPVALSILGFKVKIVDRYEFYGEAFKNAVEKTMALNSVDVFDLNILSDSFNSLGKNDIVLLMAVVEHFNGSPRQLLNKVHNAVSQNGFLLFEVPNIAGLIKRFRMLLGHAPMSDYEDYFYSEYPHTGHNREMNLSEVKFMLKNTGFEIEHIECYDYDDVSVKWKGRLVLALNNLLRFKGTGQSIIAKARPL